MKKFIDEHKAGLLLCVFVISALISLWYSEDTSWGSPREAGMVVSAFLQSGVHGVSSLFSSTVNSFNELSALKKEYEALSLHAQDLERQQSDLEGLRRENDRLRQVLTFSMTSEYSNIPAQVIAKDPGVLFYSFVINKGYNHGVRSQMPVISIIDGKKGLVGKIGTVSAFSSQVIPIFDARNNVAGRFDDGRYEGLIKGQGSYQERLKMVYIDPKAQSFIQVGSQISTSGLSSLYPPEIPIGKVSSFTVKPHVSTLEIEVESIVDFTRLEYVYVLIPGGTK